MDEAQRPRLHGIVVSVRIVLHEHLPLAVIVMLYVASGIAFREATDLTGTMRTAWRVPAIDAAFRTLILSFLPLQLFLRVPFLREGFPGFTRALRDIRQRYLSVRALGGLAIVWLLLAPFHTTFASFKQSIYKVRPFSWDEALLWADEALHVGHQPWEILHPFLGDPAITAAIDRLYVLWFAVFIGSTLLMAWASGRRLRMQYLLSAATIWIGLGSILAMLLSSSGPCYHARVNGLPDPFAPLMEYLHVVHEQKFLFAIVNQELLWESQQEGRWIAFGGISGMPSLHVAVAGQLALLGWRLNRPTGVLLTAFALVTLIGSVHLGWHWAVDGYLSLVLVPPLWWACGRFVDWWGIQEPGEP